MAYFNKAYMRHSASMSWTIDENYDKGLKKYRKWKKVQYGCEFTKSGICFRCAYGILLIAETNCRMIMCVPTEGGQMYIRK